LGSKGQIGTALVKNLSLNCKVELICLAREDIDFEYYERLDDILFEYRPNIVINAVAFTDVENAEKHQNLVDKVNCFAVEKLAVLCKKLNALLIHFSSDYVFDGSFTKPYAESSDTCPLNYYGLSKRNSDAVIQKIGGQYFIFRCSWVYSYHNNNFPSRILEKAQKQDEIFVVNDVWGAPTSANLIAKTVSQVISLYIDQMTGLPAYGVYNIASLGKTTWFDFTVYLFKLLTQNNLTMKYPQIIPISSEQYASNVLRPKNSVLDMSKIKMEFSLHLPDWQTDLKLWLNEHPNFNKKN
jgi:dTDP-4-dehydrorhamnose reductase